MRPRYVIREQKARSEHFATAGIKPGQRANHAMKLTPEMIKALCTPMPNIHKMWQQYATSQFRRDYLASWAGEDPEKRRAAKELLDETTPM